MKGGTSGHAINFAALAIPTGLAQVRQHNCAKTPPIMNEFGNGGRRSGSVYLHLQMKTRSLREPSRAEKPKSKAKLGDGSPFDMF